MSPTKLSRPPYILAHPGDTAGCGYYRIMKPIEALSRSGYVAARIEMGFIPPDVLGPMAPDVVVWQRQNDERQIEMMEQYRQVLPNAYFVYEIDDALGSVPDASYHQPFMSPTIDARVPRAASLCDVITVTTIPLQEHMQKLCPDVPVRVIANMLTRTDIEKAGVVRAKQAPITAEFRTRKFRVGWGGGMGHAGDLAILNEAFVALKDEVEWVFIGFKPELPDGVSFQYVNAVAPDAYIEALAGLDVDVIVAPLEDNHFNHCKSNLRLIEAGACQYPVIASPIGPYLTKRPPVYYADRPEDWPHMIRRLAAMTPAGRKTKAQELLKWVERNYLAEDNHYQRITAWLPDDVAPYIPFKNLGTGAVIARGQHRVETLCDESNADVIYVRDGAVISDEMLMAMHGRRSTERTGAILAVSNDGGPAAFPTPSTFTPMPREYGDTIALICAEIGGCAKMSVSAGPVVSLSRRAMNLIGKPDFAFWDHPELAILEWSMQAAASGFTTVVDMNSFARVDKPENMDGATLERLSRRLTARWPLAPAEDAVLADFREAAELRFHRGNFRQLPPQDRSDYTLWAKHNDTLGLEGMKSCFAWYETTSKPAIKVIFYGDDRLTEDMFDEPDSWRLFIPEGATPSQAVIAHAVEAILRNPDALIFYGDHDYAIKGVRSFHDLKPNFDLHLLMNRDYVTQAMLVSPAGLRFVRSHAGNDRPAGCVLYEVALSLGACQSENYVVHIPRVMAHLEPFDMEQEARNAAHRAYSVNALAEAHGWPIQAQPHKDLRNYQDVRYIAPAKKPKVAIIIPTTGDPELLTPCLATIFKMTKYDNFEVVILRKYFSGIEPHPDKRVREIIYTHPEFNWSEINNVAAQQTEADYFVFLNDDTRVLEADWLEQMVGAAQFPGVGVVGAKLSFPHGHVQHVGLVASYGNAGHIHLGLPLQYAGYNGIAALSHEATAVTGACMLVSRKVFDELGGFNTDLSNNFNDVAFCLEARKAGYKNVVAIGAHLQHIATASRGAMSSTAEGFADTAKAAAFMRSRYGDADPYWNPNLLFAVDGLGTTAVGTGMDILAWPAPAVPWDKSAFQRLLVVGPKEAAHSEVRDRDAIYNLLVQGNMAQIVDPPMANVRAFDLRDPDTAAQTIQALGIDKIIVSTLEHGASLLLSFITRLGVPVEYRPRNAESVCPRRDLRPNGSTCTKGWTKPGECQTCIDIHGSPNGYVTIDAWTAEWRRFINRSNVSVQLQYLEATDYGDAIGHLYGGSPLEDIPTA